MILLCTQGASFNHEPVGSASHVSAFGAHCAKAAISAALCIACPLWPFSNPKVMLAGDLAQFLAFGLLPGPGRYNEL